MISEIKKTTLNGIGFFLAFVVFEILVIFGFISSVATRHPVPAALAVLTFIVLIVFLAGGLFRVQPNQAVALTLFGKYVGSTRTPGLRWTNPFLHPQKISLRVRNFESGVLKINDLHGSPIEIAAVVVWRVVDSAQALFDVDDYQDFVKTQSEAAIRQMASSYPYDSGEADSPDEITLRGHANEISEHLQKELNERLTSAGVDVIETRITHLAYAPEIAGAMLQRQQASAIIAARSRIVEGAVGMVEMALRKLEETGSITLDEERRAAMVSNLMVVLCSDRATQPVVNTGSLYQ
jgi:regulator of protease activity HflC (stomatin/prohibitin superfamily)